MTDTTIRPNRTTPAPAVYVPLTIAFDPDVLTAAYISADDAARTELAEVVQALHDSTGYTDVCTFFTEYLAGCGLTDADAPWFTVTGTSTEVALYVWIEPSSCAGDGQMDGVDIVAAIHTLPGHTPTPGTKTVIEHTDEDRWLYGTDRDPLATLLALGDSVAVVLTEQLAAADAFDTGRTAAA